MNSTYTEIMAGSSGRFPLFPLSRKSSSDEVAVVWESSPTVSFTESRASFSVPFCINMSRASLGRSRYWCYSFPWLGRVASKIALTVKSILPCCFDAKKIRQELLRDTFSWLETTFGTHRVARSLLAIGIDKNTLCNEGSLLRVRDVAALFSQLELVREIDVQEVLDDVKISTDQIRSIVDSKVIKIIKTQLSGKTFQTLDQEDILVIEAILLPFQKKKYELLKCYVPDSSLQETATCRYELRKALLTQQPIPQNLRVLQLQVQHLPSLPSETLLPSLRGYISVQNLTELLSKKTES